MDQCLIQDAKTDTGLIAIENLGVHFQHARVVKDQERFNTRRHVRDGAPIAPLHLEVARLELRRGHVAQ